MNRFPRFYAAASLKRDGSGVARTGTPVSWSFSAVLCRGLIEASTKPDDSVTRRSDSVFSAVLCRGLIEAGWWQPALRTGALAEFSAVLCRGLIEARSRVTRPRCTRRRRCFPRFYAAASLKLRPRIDATFSSPAGRFPRFYAAASLKHIPGLREPLYLSGFPRFYAAASLKPQVRLGRSARSVRGFPRFLCRGLIEARSSARSR